MKPRSAARKPIIGVLAAAASGFDARQRAKARQRFAIEVAGALVGISRRRDRHPHREHVVGVESQGAIQRDERANEDTGAAERTTVMATCTTTSACRTGARDRPSSRASATRRPSIAARTGSSVRGRRSRRSRATGRTLDQHASIDEQLGDAEQVRGGHGEQRVETPAREREAERAAGAGEQQAFDQQRSRNRPASRPE